MRVSADGYQIIKRLTLQRKGARISCLCKINLGFGFDDEEGVGVGAAGGAEFLAGFVEGVGEDGEDDFALEAADEIEAAFLLDELELGRHLGRGTLLARRRRPRKAAATKTVARNVAIGSIHTIGKRIKGKLDASERKIDLYQIGTDAAGGEGGEFGGEFAG